MQGGVILNPRGFAYQKDVDVLYARLAALEAKVASLRINQHSNDAEHTEICPSCKSKLCHAEADERHCWNCGVYWDESGKLRHC